MQHILRFNLQYSILIAFCRTTRIHNQNTTYSGHNRLCGHTCNNSVNNGYVPPLHSSLNTDCVCNQCTHYTVCSFDIGGKSDTLCNLCIQPYYHSIFYSLHKTYTTCIDNTHSILHICLSFCSNYISGIL